MRNQPEWTSSDSSRNALRFENVEIPAIPISAHGTVAKEQFESSLGSEYLKVHIAEYQWLRQEIRDRSDYQHRIVQIHVSALTLLLVTGFSGSFSKWIVLAIPFESAIFGLWWLDHASTIRTIGRYLADEVEPKIDRALGGENVVEWERRVENAGERGIKAIVKGYQSVSDFTFIWPSLVILLLCAFGTVVTSSLWPEGDRWAHAVDIVNRLFPLAEEFEGLRTLILAFSTLVIALMFSRYLRQYVRFGALVQNEKQPRS